MSVQRHALNAALILTLFQVAVAPAQENAIRFKSAEARQAISEHKAALQQLNGSFASTQRHMARTYEVEAAKLRDKLLQKLSIAQEEATREADLDEAIKIRDAATKYKSLELSPPGCQATTSDATSQETIEKLQAEVARLEKEVASLSKQQRVKPKIPKTAVRFKGHSYAVVDIPTVSRLAIVQAWQLGGHLVQIENAEENEFVVQLIQPGRHKSYWIDGFDDIKAGVWVYSNGKKVEYFNWDRGQPSNHACEWACLIGRRYGRIHDANGNDKCGFVVEWDE